MAAGSPPRRPGRSYPSDPVARPGRGDPAGRHSALPEIQRNPCATPAMLQFAPVYGPRDSCVLRMRLQRDHHHDIRFWKPGGVPDESLIPNRLSAPPVVSNRRHREHHLSTFRTARPHRSGKLMTARGQIKKPAPQRRARGRLDAGITCVSACYWVACLRYPLSSALRKGLTNV